MTAAVSRADIYTDPQGLNDLRTRAVKSGTDPETLRTVAGQFEALFIQMMLKSMRDASLGEGIFDSDQSETCQSLFDQQISIDLARQQGLGLADMMVQQLQPRGSAAGVKSKDAPDSSALPVAPAKPTVIAPAATSDTKPTAQGVADWGPASPEAFVRNLRPHADAAAHALGVDPEFLIAQAALETGWGQTMIRDGTGANSYNFFGIKADPSWNGAKAATGTLELRDGVMRRENAQFRAYANPADSFNDYVAFLQSNPRYSKALDAAGDGAAYVRELQRAGYATDPAYASKIMQIVESEPFRQTVTKIKNETFVPLS